MDMLIALTALIFAYIVRFDTVDIPFSKEFEIFKKGLPVYLVIRGATFYLFGMFKGIIRHTSLEDMKRVFLAVSFGSLVIALVSVAKYAFFDHKFLFPTTVIFAEYFICIFLLVVFRIAVKLIYVEGLKDNKSMVPTLIYGAGIYGLITKHTLEKDTKINSKVIGFIDDNKDIARNRLEGVKIYNTSSLQNVINKYEVKRVIVAIKNPNNQNKRKVIDVCLANGVEVLNVPDPKRWINGEFSSGQIKPIKIENLLGREPIKLDKDLLAEEFRNKKILVTGAAGSIGQEIVKQLTHYEPSKIILLDQAESPLYDLQMELKEKEKLYLTETVIGDIRNLERLENVFRTFKPQIVFHAAAYKHVPLMEENPSEAILTNVKGSKNLVDLAVKYKVEKFVQVSTDKAVNPTNVMGCSKRIAEIYAQAMNSQSDTKFITTRFGNVLGSNGSVIPLFKRQIEAGGPLTVTDKRITRFFMTIPEACQLVLEAGLMGIGGEIFVFDMGESVKIYDLALKMIKLSGLEVGKDIEIKITGLRPGEKLYEELLANDENTLPTHHPQILKAKVRTYDFEEISKNIDELNAMFVDQVNDEIVGKMKAIVPEFISNNSQFSKLDDK
ncbi:MAG: polysaccharide biosynthesis protein [Putridiphycobacter sp.]